MNDTIDDLTAVRIIYDALIQLDEPTRERVLRWVSEKIDSSTGKPSSPSKVRSESSATEPKKQRGRPKAISKTKPVSSTKHNEVTSFEPTASEGLKTFLLKVQPKTANQIIAATARYFEYAPTKEKRSSIDTSDVESAYTAMGKNVPNYIGQLLVTGKNAGYLRSSERGRYSLTVLGEEMLSEVSAAPLESI